MSAGVWVLIVAVVRRRWPSGCSGPLTDGRFRGTHQVHGAETPPVDRGPGPPSRCSTDTPWADDLGERATLLQFSSAFCAPCRAARRVLGDVAAETPGVAHIEVDAEHHLDVVRRLGILRTPTTIVLSAGGVEVTRASGAPTRQQVLTALEMVVEQP